MTKPLASLYRSLMLRKVSLLSRCLTVIGWWLVTRAGTLGDFSSALTIIAPTGNLDNLIHAQLKARTQHCLIVWSNNTESSPTPCASKSSANSPPKVTDNLFPTPSYPAPNPAPSSPTSTRLSLWGLIVLG